MNDNIHLIGRVAKFWSRRQFSRTKLNNGKVRRRYRPIVVSNSGYLARSMSASENILVYRVGVSRVRRHHRYLCPRGGVHLFVAKKRPRRTPPRPRHRILTFSNSRMTRSRSTSAESPSPARLTSFFPAADVRR
jgi:hypothetical protein